MKAYHLVLLYSISKGGRFTCQQTTVLYTVFVKQTYPEKHVKKEEKILDKTAHFCSVLSHRDLM